MSDNESNQAQNPERHPDPAVRVIREEDDDMFVDDTDSDDDEEFHPAVQDIAVGPHLPGPVQSLPEGLLGQIGAHRLHSSRAWASQRPIRFVENYRVISASQLESRGHNQNLETGGKVILPPSALQQLTRNSSALLSPMLFKTTNPVNQRFSHCGVLEFIAEEDLCYMPTWMMTNLGLIDNDMINIEKVTLPTATFAKFEPQAVDFLDIDNPKAVLENCLRFFSCLTKGDLVPIYYNNRVYQLNVLEILPSDAVTIIECDMDVDFAAPVGYVSPNASRDDMEEGVAGPSNPAAFVPFQGSGVRLNGKTIDEAAKKKTTGVAIRGVPDTDWKIGSLRFQRKFAKPKTENDKPTEEAKFTAFGGTGQTLKKQRDNPSEDSLDL